MIMPIRSGGRASAPPNAVVAAAMNHSELLALETTATRSWPAAEEERHGNWLLRANHGYTKRANSAYAVGAVESGDLPLLQKWYRSRALPLYIREVSLHTNSGLGEHLTSHGFSRFDETLIMTTGLTGSEPGDIQTVALDDWLRLFTRFEGATKGDQRRHGELIERIATPVLLAVAEADREPVACGLGVCDGQWLGLFDIATDPDRRRAGHGRRLVKAMLGWGGANGATGAWLQVVASNQAAIGLYEALGFREAYRAWYWRLGS